MRKIISSLKKKIAPNPNSICDKYHQIGSHIITNDRSFYKKLKILSATSILINALLILSPDFPNLININLAGLLGFYNIVILVVLIMLFVELLGKTKLKAKEGNIICTK